MLFRANGTSTKLQPSRASYGVPFEETRLVRLALAIAEKAHAGQVDKAGRPYLEHPIYVARQMKDKTSVAIALLHDVLEDSSLFSRELFLLYGIPEDVISAVETLSCGESETYMEYIERVKLDPVARKVKLADLEHNADINRIREPSEEDYQRQKKYLKAIRRLQE